MKRKARHYWMSWLMDKPKMLCRMKGGAAIMYFEHNFKQITCKNCLKKIQFKPEGPGK